MPSGRWPVAGVSVPPAGYVRLMLCMNCLRPGADLCVGCRRSLMEAPSRMVGEHLIVRAAYVHTGLAKRLVHDLKYRGLVGQSCHPRSRDGSQPAGGGHFTRPDPTIRLCVASNSESIPGSNWGWPSAVSPGCRSTVSSPLRCGRLATPARAATTGLPCSSGRGSRPAAAPSSSTMSSPPAPPSRPPRLHLDPGVIGAISATSAGV